MTLTSKNRALIVAVVISIVLIGWISIVTVNQIRDDRSFLGQLRLIFFPKSHTLENQVKNFREDLVKSGDYWTHNRLGREYASMRNYSMAIEEYNKAIEIIQSDPGEQWNNVSKTEMDRINEESRVSRQLFSRHRLVEVYVKAGRYQEALEQIDWLLAHNPLPYPKQELLAKKSEIVQKLGSDKK